MKRQAQIALDKASKSCGFIKQISMLEDKVSSLMARIVHLEECDSFLIGTIESICEMLWCEFLCSILFPFSLHYCCLMSFCYLRYLPGLCRWNTSGFWANYSFGEIIRGNRQFVVWSRTPSCYCATSGSCSPYWRGSWWLLKIPDDHVFYHTSSQSSAWKLSTATQHF
jgi:hypothetical protein